MTTPATPVVSRRPSIPLIWVVPLLALAIAGWMIFQQFRNRGPEITVEFANGSGIEAGKTELEHKGVTVGSVMTVALKPDLSGVIVHVRLTKAGAGVARAGSEFWVVHPELSLSGIRGLETLVTGVRMQVRPGTGPAATAFRGLDRPPPVENREAGRAFVLRTDKLDGVTPGAPVYYRGVKIGAVETTRLADDATAALIRIRVFRAYTDLVRTNTQFWNAGGIDFKLGIHGAELRADSIESLFAGGVALGTPDQGELAPPALDGTEFVLHEKAEKEWLEWHPRIPIQPVDTGPESGKNARMTPLPMSVSPPST
jgi:paraquat-inducible protein B